MHSLALPPRPSELLKVRKQSLVLDLPRIRLPLPIVAETADEVLLSLLCLAEPEA